MNGEIDRPVTTRFGFSMKPATVDEEGRQRFLSDIRAVIDRPMAVGVPGAYLVRRGEIQPSGGYMELVRELPPGHQALDPLGFIGALSERSALKATRELIKRETQRKLQLGKYPKPAVLAEHRIKMSEAKKALEDIGPETIGRVERVVPEHGEGVIARHTRVSHVDPAAREIEIGINPELIDYKGMVHEFTGHEGGAMLREALREAGVGTRAGKRFASWWEDMRIEMKSAQAVLEKYGLKAEADRVYKWNPDEMFSNVVSDLMDKGITKEVAKKHAALEVFKRRVQITDSYKRSLGSIQELLEAEGKTLDVDAYLRGLRR